MAKELDAAHQEASAFLAEALRANNEELQAKNSEFAHKIEVLENKLRAQGTDYEKRLGTSRQAAEGLQAQIDTLRGTNQGLH